MAKKLAETFPTNIFYYSIKL